MHAGIAGAGIMGRLLAFALCDIGWQVTLFEQHEGDTNCSSVAAGLLTPVSELDRADILIFHLGQASIQTLWSRILQACNASSCFQQSGSLVLHHPRDAAEWGHYRRRISSQLDNSASYVQALSHDALMQLEPELVKFEKVYYFPGEAHIDCQALMPALMRYLDAQGVECHMNTTVLSLAPGEMVTSARQHVFDMVFDCRGLGAGSMFKDLRALRGEMIGLHAPEVRLQRPIRFLHPRYSLYIVPRPGQMYLIGASEIEAEDHTPISVRTTLDLLTAAYYIHAGFAEARIVKTVTHCRPTLSNHLPRIQYTEGLMAVNGLYRHGYLIAPALAAEMVRGLQSHQQNLHYPTIWEPIHASYLPQ